LALLDWLSWPHGSAGSSTGNTEAKLREATLLTEKRANEVKSLKEQLKISPGNVEALQAAYDQEKNKPATTFYVQATTLPAATEQVQDR